jgi:hypothetical protein
MKWCELQSFKPSRVLCSSLVSRGPAKLRAGFAVFSAVQLFAVVWGAAVCLYASVQTTTFSLGDVTS